MNSPSKVKALESELALVKAELKTAEKDPTLMELMFKLEEKNKEIQSKKNAKDALIEERVEGHNAVDLGSWDSGFFRDDFL